MSTIYVALLNDDGTGTNTVAAYDDPRPLSAYERREALERAIDEQLIVEPGTYIVASPSPDGIKTLNGSIFTIEEITTPKFRIKD